MERQNRAGDDDRAAIAAIRAERLTAIPSSFS
jgi:hypothetical protein